MKKMMITAGVAALLAITLTSCIRFDVKRENKYEPVAQISREDADSILEEKLEETDYEFRYKSLKGIDGVSYYLYDISMDKGKTREHLAVEAVSGEVFYYDEATGEMSDYSSFSGYDEKSDESIEWTGKYVSKEKGVVEIEEQDPGSFEFSIKPKKGDKVSGFAYKENSVEAVSELSGVKIIFNLDGKELVIGGAEQGTEYDGTYERK